MNVMAQAHKQAKAAKVERPNIHYRVLFRLALIQSHKEYKTMQNEKALAIAHFEGVLARTIEVYENLGVNDWFVGLVHGEGDVTLLKHKDANDKNSPLGWAGYSDAIRTSKAQADEYAKAYPSTKPVHAVTHLLGVIDNLRKCLAESQG